MTTKPSTRSALLRSALLATTATGLLLFALPAAAQDRSYVLPDPFAGLSTRAMPVAVVTPGSAASFQAPEYYANHGLAQIGAADAYALGLSGKGVLVAVVDSGIAPDHPEFAGRISPFSRNFGLDVPGATDLLDRHEGSHGTHVAGTIAAARDGVGMHGVAYNAEILVLRAIVGPPGGDTASAISHAAAVGAKVLNGSYGPAYPSPFLPGGIPNPDYQVFPIQPYQNAGTEAEVAALRQAAASDMVLVFAAGNERQDQPVIARNPSGVGFYPAINPANAGKGLYVFFDGNGDEVDASRKDYSDLRPYLMTVVAVDRTGKIADFSNYCGIAAAWCLAAPGVDILSTVTADKGLSPTQPYNLSSGTSMAAPHVAGAAALVREAFPFMTAPQVVQSILTTATDLGSPEIYGWGLLNVSKAVRGPGQFVETFDVDTKGWSATFANDISGDGGLIKRGAGRLELSGRNSYAGGTGVLGGTLAINGSVASAVSVGSAGTLRGTGLIEAGLFSAGTVMPGNSPGTLFVRGPVTFADSNRFALDIDGTGTGNGAGNYSRLVAMGSTGAVAVGGRLVPTLRGIVGDAGNSYVPTIGTAFGVLVAEGGLAGSFSGLDQPADGLPANARFDALYRGNGLSLIVTPASYGGLTGLGGNALAVAGALDAARPAAGVRPDAARQEVFDALYQTGPDALATGLGTLTGQAYADARMSMMAGQRMIGSALDRRLTAGGATSFGQASRIGTAGYASLGASPAATDAPRAVAEGVLWGQALYGVGHAGGGTAGPGSSFGLGGALLGVERALSGDAVLGAALGYARSVMDPKGDVRGRATVDSYSLSAYGGTRIGAISLRGSLGGSYGRTELRRTVSLGPVQRLARGSSDGYGIFGSAFAGYDLAALGGMSVTPELGLSAAHLRQGGTVESQAGAFGLTLRGESQNSLRSLAGARLSTALGSEMPLRVDLKAYWSHEFADTVAVQRASLLGAAFVTRSAGVSRDGAVIGASLSGTVLQRVELTGSYDGDLRRGAMAHRFALEAKTRW